MWNLSFVLQKVVFPRKRSPGGYHHKTPNMMFELDLDMVGFIWIVEM